MFFKKKYTSNEVANYFLAIDKGNISVKKLQILVYYSYALTLTLLNESSDNLINKLFEDDKFIAGVHGPKIMKIYKKYKSYGFSAIQDKPERPIFSQKVEDILDQVWKEYGNYTGVQLESIIQQEQPWINARVGFSPIDKCTKVISDKDIFDFYIQYAK